MEYITEYLTASNIMFCVLSAMVLICGLLSVTSTRILRAATFLFFTLFGVAGLYLQMSYDFLAAVQLSVYAGGIVVLLIFAILLIKNLGEETEKVTRFKYISSAVASLSGLLIVGVTIFGYEFMTIANADEIAQSVDMKLIGETLMGTDEKQYLLVFEAASILLLACIVGSVVVANKSKEEI